MLQDDTEVLSKVVTQLYGALLDPFPLKKLLKTLKLLIPSSASALILRTPSEVDMGAIWYESEGEGTPMASENPYTTKYYKLDPFNQLPDGQVVTLEECLGDVDELEKNEFYQQNMQPYGIRYILGLDLADSRWGVVSFRLIRGPESESYSSEERQLFEQLVPHLRQILAIHRQYERLESERSLFAGAVGRLAAACLIIDEHYRIIWKNKGADQMLQEYDVISSANGVFKLSSADVNTAFCEAVDDIMEAQGRGDHSLAHAFSVPRTSESAPLGLVARGVPHRDSLDTKANPSVAVFISDPDQQYVASMDILKELFDLTPAEARVSLLLADGYRLEVAAELLNISIYTVRAHLRSIYEKMNVNQQSQLVSLILRSVASYA